MNRTREAILRLINHPGTSEAERNAAVLALRRVDGLDNVITTLKNEQKHIAKDLGSIFKKQMRRISL